MNVERSMVVSVLLCSLLISVPIMTSAETIAVIGTGNVGRALGTEFAAQGHTIIYGSRDPSRESVRALVAETGADASATTPGNAIGNADMVVLAVPGIYAMEVVAGLGDLSGKIIIDPTNPVRPIANSDPFQFE